MNLNTATPQELELYKANVCTVLDIDPMMLDYIDLPDPMGRGIVNKVLYAKRGAAEILRSNLKISVNSLVPQITADWLMFTATATNPAGRQEIAVGAAYLTGVSGDKLAHVIMTAQTRAVRRVTLQFVTGGILDESEVQSQSQFMNAPAATGAQLSGSPMVIPPVLTVTNSAPGKDITPKTEFQVPLPPHVGTNVVVIPPASIPAESVSVSVKQAVSANAENPPATENPAPKVRKPRRKKGEVDIASVQTEMPTGQIDAAGIITPDPIDVAAAQAAQAAAQEVFEKQQAEMRAEAQRQLQEKISAPAAAPVVPVAAVSAVGSAQPVPAQVPAASLSPEKAKEFKDRTRVYANDVLPKGGMMPSEGIGGVTLKLRKFAQVHTGATDPNLNLTQSEELFEFLDDYLKQNGPAALVAYIDKAIGATK